MSTPPTEEQRKLAAEREKQQRAVGFVQRAKFDLSLQPAAAAEPKLNSLQSLIDRRLKEEEVRDQFNVSLTDCILVLITKLSLFHLLEGDLFFPLHYTVSS